MNQHLENGLCAVAGSILIAAPFVLWLLELVG
jgi:hypothetical protein